MKIFRHLLPILVLLCINLFLFFPLFFPEPHIFATPDSYLSDIIHLNFPLKYLLSESLQTNSLPMWTNLIGTGYPPIAEGQIQAFSLINLMLFKFLPFVYAFNFQYLIIFAMLSIGMYILSIELGFKRITALFTAIIFAFGGLPIAKIPHLNNLQALSFTPLIFWTILKIKKNHSSRIWLVLPFLLSQQIFQGHYQYIFMTYIVFSLYFFITWFIPEKNDRWFIMKRFAVIGIFTILMSSAQLIPSAEYFIKSGGREGLHEVEIGSFLPKHLLQFIYPYILGDSRSGGYKAPVYGVAFLETFSYIGLLPLILSFVSIFYVKKNKWVKSLWIMVGILFLFVFEKNSPIYFLFTFPPFSWFRVQSRFLAFITLFLTLLSGFFFDQILKFFENSKEKKRVYVPILPHIQHLQQGIGYAILVISTVDLLFFASSFNPILPAVEVLQPPELFHYSDKTSRMTTLTNQNSPWVKYVYTKGWQNPSDYLYLSNEGRPNYPLLFSQPQLPIYSGFLPKKQQRLLYFALQTTTIDDEDKNATLSATTLNILRLTNTKNIFTTVKLTNPDVSLVHETMPPKTVQDKFYLYALKDVKPYYYLTNSYEQTPLLEDFKAEMEKKDILQKYDAFITTYRSLPQTSSKKYLTIRSDSTTKKTFTIETPDDTYFIASIYFYPGWKADIDGTPVTIEPANLSGMGIFIPKGSHTLTIQFVPYAMYIGIAISAAAYCLYIGMAIQSFRHVSS